MKKQITGMNMQLDIADNKASEGYRKLAAAIIRSGERENDQSFLNSEWCETLRYFINLGQRQSASNLDGTQSYTKYI